MAVIVSKTARKSPAETGLDRLVVLSFPAYNSGMEENQLTIVDALQRFGKLDWYAIRPGELVGQKALVPSRLTPPLITFRYAEHHQAIARKLQLFTSAFCGNVSWEVTHVEEKNSCLLPKRVGECKSKLGGVSTQEAVEFVAENDKSFVQAAIVDIPKLLIHLAASAASEAPPSSNT